MALTNIKHWYKTHERRATTIAILLGFVVDNFTLQRIDFLFENVLLLSYLVMAGVGIALVNLYDAGVLKSRVFVPLRLWAPLLVQYAFGALFSGFIVFYMRSATLSVSALFIVFLLILLLGNELFKKQYTRLSFQISMFFIGVFSYLIFSVPVVVKAMNGWVFILSGVLSVCVLYVFVRTLYTFIPERIHRVRTVLTTSIGLIFIAMNGAYVFNLIPPLPLSLKDIGVYYSVERVEGNYIVQYEDRGFLNSLNPQKALTLPQGASVSVYSAIFAPTDLRTSLLHVWQYYDEKKEVWVTTDRLLFSISGGRDEGYRGYSSKRNTFEGRWRVNVITENKKLLGRITFEIKRSLELIQTKTQIK